MKSQVILTFSLLVLVVSATLVYFSGDMIYQDKRAYLYDDSYQSINSSLKQLEAALEAKVRTVRASVPENHGIDDIDLNFWAQDKDLYQIRVFPYSDAGMELNRTIFDNKKFKVSGPQKAAPKEIALKTVESYFPAARKEGMIRALVREPKSASRLLVMVHLPGSRAFVLFDFITDKILENVFLGVGYDITIMTTGGQAYFNNKPYNVTPAQEAFYKNFVATMAAESGSKSGVKELFIDKNDQILSFARSEAFPDLFVLGAIKTSEAYEVTRLFIMNTSLYALGLIGLFNILALFMARSVTNPLDRLNETIKSISEGNYTARVEPQKITELQLVGDSFNVMVDKIQEYNARLEEYNRSLEQKVEERTRELREASNFIRAMVDSLSQGLLVFNREGTCRSDYTKACRQLFGRSPAGEDVATLINYSDPATFKTWVNTLFEEPMPFEDLLPFGPQYVEAAVPWTDESFKHIALEFFPMRNDDKVENVVMVATDKTQEFKAAKENEAQQTYIAMLSKLLKDKETFVRFVGQFQEVMAANKAPAAVDRLAFMRQVHSFKGMAGFLNLTTLVEHLHLLENDLTDEGFDLATLDPRIDRALELLQGYLDQIQAFSPDILNPSEQLEVNEERLEEFYNMLVPMDQDYAAHFKFHFMSAPVEKYVEQYKALIQDLAAKLHKKVNPLVIVGGDLMVDRKAYQPFFDSCIHLFRNSLDHGIETLEKRIERGKPDAGTITLTFDLKSMDGKKYLFFEMKDDGGGISVDAIRSKMKKLNYPPEEADETDDRLVLSHIFDAEFSTAETTTELSGRGIGLFDVKTLVEKYEGNILLETTVGVGTTFTFYLKFL